MTLLGDNGNSALLHNPKKEGGLGVDDILDFLFYFLLDPIFDLFTHKRFTGAWRFSALLPIAVLAFLVLVFFGVGLDIPLLTIIGAIGAIVSLLASICFGIARDREWREEWRDRKRKHDESQ